MIEQGQLYKLDGKDVIHTSAVSGDSAWVRLLKWKFFDDGSRQPELHPLKTEGGVFRVSIDRLSEWGGWL